MKIKFNNSNQMYDIASFQNIGNKLIIIKGEDIPENTSGFQLIQGDDVLKDYSDFTTKYNVITPLESILMFSNNENYVETDDNPASEYFTTPSENIKEIAEPLTNVELTEAVADLMYEMSIANLGL